MRAEPKKIATRVHVHVAVAVNVNVNVNVRRHQALSITPASANRLAHFSRNRLTGRPKTGNNPRSGGRTVSPAEIQVESLLQGTPFRFISVLGEGGMGIVLEAEDLRCPGERVAVKLLHERLVADVENLERFRTEAEVAGLLNHPNIVQVLELRMPPAVRRPYYVMELLRGESLVDRLHRCGALDVDDAVDICIQALRGLAAVHAAGVVHRDVKPGNLFLCGAGGETVVKLLDFGIAKLMAAGAGDRKLTPHSFRTREGSFVGTALYASPEQGRGLNVDRRTDLYAMGNVLYNMLTGRSPFGKIRGTKELLVAHQVTMPEPPSKLARSPVPPELDDIVMAALAKRTEDRLGTAEQFIEALEDIRTRMRASTGWLRTQAFDTSPEPDRESPRKKGRSRSERPRAERSPPSYRSPVLSVVVGLAVGSVVFFLVMLAWKVLS